MRMSGPAPRLRLGLLLAGLGLLAACSSGLEHPDFGARFYGVERTSLTAN